MRRRMLFVAATVGMGVALALPGVSGAQFPPTQDSVVLEGGPAQAGDLTIIEIDATSGPSGENPTGQVRFDAFGSINVGGPVTCLAVRGRIATINIDDQLGGLLGVVTVEVLDRVGQPDFFGAANTARAPTDCSPITLRELVFGGNIRVVDAHPTCFGVAADDDDVTAGDDVIVGTEAGDTIDSLAGNDRICSLAGSDSVTGNTGNDQIKAGSGADAAFGGSGHDRVSGGRADDDVRGQTGNDVLEGNKGGDDLTGAAGSDRLSGNDGDDHLIGGAGHDVCDGGPGTDTAQQCEVLIAIP